MKKNQAGFSFWSLLVIFSIIGFVTLSILKIFPVYLENMSVSKSVETLQEDPKISHMSANNIKETLLKKFDVNGVTDVNKSHIKIIRTTEDLSVSVIYEVRKHYFANIDLVFSFSDEFTVVNSRALEF